MLQQVVVEERHSEDLVAGDSGQLSSVTAIDMLDKW
jgi:hypothetical protein